jgi:hypothetical protein
MKKTRILFTESAVPFICEALDIINDGTNAIIRNGNQVKIIPNKDIIGFQKNLGVIYKKQSKS